jgi:uncharacterized protein YodC (DUF2158 family)
MAYDPDNPEFPVGSLVRLRSGGPELVVEKSETFDGIGLGVGVIWFDMHLNLQRADLPSDTLVRITEESEIVQ